MVSHRAFVAAARRLQQRPHQLRTQGISPTEIIHQCQVIRVAAYGDDIAYRFIDPAACHAKSIQLTILGIETVRQHDAGKTGSPGRLEHAGIGWPVARTFQRFDAGATLDFVVV